MRKFSKRVLAVTLSTAMVFSLAACNKSNNNPTDSTTSQGQTGESTSATDGSSEIAFSITSLVSFCAIKSLKTFKD